MIDAVKQLTHPNAAGAAEYRALHELLKDAATLDEAIAICEEMQAWAVTTANTLKQQQP